MRLTMREAVRTGTNAIKAIVSDDAGLEARTLLLFVTGRSRTDLYTREDDVLSADETERFVALVTERLTGTPLQHLIGAVDFRMITLKCDARALIPRPDSEIVVELALEQSEPRVIADLGTGSGCLLLSFLSERPEVTGIGVDADGEALQLARENAVKLELAARTEFFHGSWSAWTGWRDCDLIISNPPYIRSDVIPTLNPDVRDYDPMAALDGGPDGLDAYREIIQLGAEQMKAGAHLVLEIGYDQKQQVTDLLDQAGFRNLQHRQDLGGNDRAIAATKS